MVLGIGEGRIEIVLDKAQYHPGETLNGRLVLFLNGEKKARALRIRFYGILGQQWKRSRGKKRIFFQEYVFSGEKIYAMGRSEYPFQFQLPMLPKYPNIGDTVRVDGEMTEAKKELLAKAIASTVGTFLDPYAWVTWVLDASLDIPRSLDINKKIEIRFTR